MGPYFGPKVGQNGTLGGGGGGGGGSGGQGGCERRSKVYVRIQKKNFKGGSG